MAGSREAGYFVNTGVKDARCQIIQLQQTVVSNLNEIKLRFKFEWIGSSLSDIITARQRSCRKVMFSEACVILSREGRGKTFLDKEPPRQRTPLDREPPWTETHWTETLPHRDLPGQRPPGQRPTRQRPQTETP